MSLDTLLVYDVTILQRGAAEDKYGDPVDTFTTGATVRGWVEMTNAQEVLVRGDRRISDWLAILPAGTEVDALDRLQHDGKTFEIVSVMEAAAPATAKRHVEARMRLVEG